MKKKCLRLLTDKEEMVKFQRRYIPLSSYTLYERIGKKESLEKVVNLFCNKMAADPLLERFFKEKDLPRIKSQFTKFLTSAFAGPEEYNSKNIQGVHKGLGINDKEFNKASAHMLEALKETGMNNDIINEVDIFFEYYRKRVVEG